MTHGHEIKGGNVGGRGCAGQRGVKGGKWDNCNSIINKKYFKKYIPRLLHMQPKRDQIHVRRHTHTEYKKIEKDLSCKWK